MFLNKITFTAQQNQNFTIFPFEIYYIELIFLSFVKKKFIKSSANLKL